MAKDNFRSMQKKLFLMGVFKIPMIGYVRPRLLELNERHAKVRVRLRRRTRNHLNSMYFGALAVGADIAGGLHAFYFAEQQDQKMSFAFKAIHGEFLMRAETDIVFESNDGEIIKAVVNESLSSGERVNREVSVVAKDMNGSEVAQFKMTISVKFK